MRAIATLSVLALFLLAGLSGPAIAQDAPKSDQPAQSFLLAKVRILPKTGASETLAGARITGSNRNATNGFVELAKIEKAPADGQWLEVPVKTDTVYRFVKIEAGGDALLAVAELEFQSATGKLAGKAFGTSAAKKGDGEEAKKAFDGDPGTTFEAPIAHAYVGLDLGDDCQAKGVYFQPAGGAYAEAQKVNLHVWPPGPKVRYTVDGSTPTRANGIDFTAPIAVTTSTSIAAFTYQDGKADSRVLVASYVLGTTATLGARTKTYHIGNSLTDTVKGSLDVVGLSAGRNVTTYFKTIPGCSIIGNWENNAKGFGYPEGWANDYERVLAGKVDHLFLQPFPNPPGLKRDGEKGLNFIALARKSNPDVQPWLYAQWIEYPALDDKGKVVAAYCGQIGGQSWDKDEPEAWMPPIPNAQVKTWDDAMVNTMDYYRALLKRWNAPTPPGAKPVRLVPGGPALLALEKEIAAGKFPGVTDFGAFAFSDAIHLSSGGAYLVTLVHYACMYGESPEGKVTWATSGLTKEQAQIMQRLAWQVVLAEPDSGVKPPAK